MDGFTIASDNSDKNDNLVELICVIDVRTGNIHFLMNNVFDQSTV